MLSEALSSLEWSSFLLAFPFCQTLGFLYISPWFSFLKKHLLIYGCAGSSLLHAGFSIVVAAGGYSLVAEHRLLTVEAWWHGL